MRVGLTLLAVLAFSSSLWAASVNTTERSVTKLAEGVYAIRHPDAPDQFPQSNTTVIIGEREVLVVDSCYLPSSARADIAQIRQWTSRPVRYLINTHWHYDHTMGNGEYAAAFPGLQIVAHRETRKHIAGYNPGWFARYRQRNIDFRKELESGKDGDGKPITAERRTELQELMRGRDPVALEFAAINDQPPNAGFSDSLDLDLGNREVQLRFLGRGNTSGDVVVYLPKEKILVAGDLLDHPVPYLGGGYPVDLLATLRRVAEFDTVSIVPGHGEILHGEAHLQNVIAFLDDVVTATEREIYKAGNGPRNLDAVRAAVEQSLDLAKYRALFAGSDRDNLEFFNGFSLQGVVTAAYAQLWPK
jgi:cyclase